MSHRVAARVAWYAPSAEGALTMPETTPKKYVGPLESGTWPETLTARVATPGAHPRIHGFDVEADLARHYRLSDIMLLSLTGELPADPLGRAFEIACAFLSPASVADAPAHAAVVARLCGATTSTTVGVTAIALGEQARWIVAEHADLVAWLTRGEGPLPARYRSEDAADVAAVESLAAALAQVDLPVRALAERPTRMAGLLAVLHACGLVRLEQLEVALALARLPVAIAEAFANRATSFGEYPINLPEFRYEDAP
jgi:hypothetical protein